MLLPDENSKVKDENKILLKKIKSFDEHRDKRKQTKTLVDKAKGQTQMLAVNDNDA